MGRARAKTKKKVSQVSKTKVRFVDAPELRMVEVVCDLVAGDSGEAVVVRPRDFSGAIVKPVVRYAAGDEQAAERAAKSIVAALRKLAKHVYPVERVVVREREQRMPELTAKLQPLDALDVWLSRRPPPKTVNVADARRLVVDWLKDVPRELFEPVAVEPVVVRELFGENFMPFGGEFAVQLGRGVYAVVAEYVGARGRSNRAGKSALLAVLEGAAFGTVRGHSQRLERFVHDGEGRMLMGATLGWRDGNELRVARSVAKSGVKITIDGRSVKRDEAEGLFGGMSEADFARTVFVRADDLHGLLDQGSAQIKNDLMRWLGVAGWAEVNKRATDAVKHVRSAIGEAEVLVRQARERVEEGPPSGERIAWLESELFKLDGSAEDRLAGLRVERKEAARHREAAEVAAGRNAAQKELREAKALADVAERTHDEAHVEVQKLRAELEKVDQERDGGFDGECPVDGAECPRAEEIRGNAEAWERKAKKLKREYERVYGEYKKVSGIALEARQRYRDAVAVMRDVNDAQAVVDAGTGFRSLKKIDAEIARLEKASGNADPGKLRNELDELRADAKEYGRAKKYVSDAEKGLRELRNKLSTLQYAAMVTGRAGIPAMQVENASGEIEGMANEVLRRVTTDFSLEFRFEEEVKTRKEAECRGCGRMFEKGERKCPVCGSERRNARRDVFLPMVREGGAVREFDLDSGGGKSLLAIAVRAALARFLGAVVLVMDEVDGRLDDANLRAFTRMVRGLTEMGFEQVFVVSHRARVAESIENRIVVTRDGSESAVAVGS